MARPAYTLEKKERIEAEIRGAALRLFTRDGYRGVSLRAIADEINLSAPALYRYYPSKEHLLASIRADGFDHLGKLFQKVRLSSASPLEVAEVALREYLAFACDQPNLYRLMYQLDQGEIADHADHNVVADRRREAFGTVRQITQQVLEVLGIDGDPNELAHLLWIGAHGLAALALANQLDLGKDYDSLIDPMIRTLLTGAIKASGNTEY